tara:strand:- start:585 stop:1004 length:420 start_codon:yes stop_codon:yes gene_type:complete
MKKASGFKMKNASVAKLAKAAGSPMKQNPSYKKAFDAMTPTKSGTRVDKFGNVYKNSSEGLANFTKAAKAYNAKKNAPKADAAPKADVKPKTNAKPKTDAKAVKTKKKFKDTRLGKFLTTKRVKGAKKKTYNPRLNRFE